MAGLRSMPAAGGFFTARWGSQLLASMRIVAALLFIEHATTKLFGFPPGAMPKPPFASFFGGLGLFEFVTGILVLIGLWTGPVAFLLSGEMAVAYFLAHFPRSPFPVVNGGEPAIFFCFVFLYLSAAGPGAWSVDQAAGAGVRGLAPRL